MQLALKGENEGRKGKKTQVEGKRERPDAGAKTLLLEGPTDRCHCWARTGAQAARMTSHRGCSQTSSTKPISACCCGTPQLTGRELSCTLHQYSSSGN